ncbi:hypothetical protein ED28_16235 [[Pantoea] beijingensis]|uniref:Uncharacterized protein n=1 Tax=[Pantoea] beijingensis TaxID=1324864 RepID=A0A443IAS0_9GAMM|nr:MULTISPECIES: hypothetical protein [Erwiniaceae]RWR00997.1 hypothetical protein ED28_16235 [[Pantoea] beijingensis]
MNIPHMPSLPGAAAGLPGAAVNAGSNVAMEGGMAAIQAQMVRDSLLKMETDQQNAALSGRIDSIVKLISALTQPKIQF